MTGRRTNARRGTHESLARRARNHRCGPAVGRLQRRGSPTGGAAPAQQRARWARRGRGRRRRPERRAGGRRRQRLGRRPRGRRRPRPPRAGGRPAARATLQSINDAGGVNGRKLDVLVRDDGWDGTKGINAARDLVEREKVFAICCTQSVSTTDPLTPYADQQKVPNIGPDGWGQVQYTGQWTFPLGVPAASEARVTAKWQYQTQGVRKAAILHLNNATGQSFRDAYKETLEKLGGKVEVIQPASFDDPGTTTLLARARAANVDTIAIYADSGIVARLVREAAGQNYKPPKGFAGSAMYYFNITPELTGPAGEGLISSSHWTPHDQATPGLRRYREVVTKYYPKIDHTAWTVTSFVGANLFADTLKKLGLNVTRQRLKDALDSTTDYDLGLGTKVSFRPGQHHANTNVHLVQLMREGDKLAWKSLGYEERDTTYDK